MGLREDQEFVELQRMAFMFGHAVTHHPSAFIRVASIPFAWLWLRRLKAAIADRAISSTTPEEK